MRSALDTLIMTMVMMVSLSHSGTSQLCLIYIYMCTASTTLLRGGKHMTTTTTTTTRYRRWDGEDSCRCRCPLSYIQTPKRKVHTLSLSLLTNLHTIINNNRRTASDPVHEKACFGTKMRQVGTGHPRCEARAPLGDVKEPHE